MHSSFLPDACGREAAVTAFTGMSEALGSLTALVGASEAFGMYAVLGLSLPSPTILAQYFVFAVLLGESTVLSRSG